MLTDTIHLLGDVHLKGYRPTNAVGDFSGGGSMISNLILPKMHSSSAAKKVPTLPLHRVVCKAANGPSNALALLAQSWSDCSALSE